MLKISGLCLLLAISTAHAGEDDWTRADTYRETAYMTLHTIDWLQTRSLAKHGWPNGHYEANPVLGTHPSVKSLDAHYIITSIGHLWIAHLLPADWRVAWQYIAIGDAGGAVINNHMLGVRIKF